MTPVKIKRTPGVCGGRPCVGDTRITVDLLRQLRGLGLSDEKLLEAYPVLTQEHLDAAWAFEENS